MSAEYEYFHHDGFKLAFRQDGEEFGEPVLLIHGFAASAEINWTQTGWLTDLLRAQHHIIAFDHRGHGLSDKSHKAEDYTPQKMASDGIALLTHLGIKKAHILGYSMGGRLAVYTALQAPERVQSAVFGGVGISILTEPKDWAAVQAGLLAEDKAEITTEEALLAREFAEKCGTDLGSAAACAINMEQRLTEEQISQITLPALVAVGAEDIELIGSPERLADLLPHGELLSIPGCDHMSAVGNAAYRKGVLEFLARHKIEQQ